MSKRKPIGSRSCSGSHRGCSCGVGASPVSFGAIIRDYRRNHRARAQDEYRFYASLSWKEALAHASMAKRRDGKRHDHQRRIPVRVLQQMGDRLRNLRLSRATPFDKLHTMISIAVRDLRGAGPLLVYDTAV